MHAGIVWGEHLARGPVPLPVPLDGPHAEPSTARESNGSP